MTGSGRFDSANDPRFIRVSLQDESTSDRVSGMESILTEAQASGRKWVAEIVVRYDTQDEVRLLASTVDSQGYRVPDTLRETAAQAAADVRDLGEPLWAIHVNMIKTTKAGGTVRDRMYEVMPRAGRVCLTGGGKGWD